VAAALIGIGAIWPAAPRAQDSIPPAPPSGDDRIAEEMDIFKARTNAINKQERIDEQTRKKKKKSPPLTTYFSYSTMAPSEIGDGRGIIGQAGHLVGKTFGRVDPLTPVEIMPYSLTDEHFVFADLRGFVSNRSYPGGNAGIGYRYLREDINAWGGASFWYDADQTSSKLFQQVGLSFEGLIRQLEVRSNVYLPISGSQVFSNTISNAQIVGNQLLYGRSIDQGVAMRGVDGEIGFSVPIRERHQIRAFVGAYHFEGGPIGNVDGFKLRAEGVINQTVKTQVLYTNDKLYGNNLMAGVSLQFPFGNRHPSMGWKQNTPSPFRFVERNYNVIVSHDQNTAGNQVAINPLTGQAYKIEQVYVAPPLNGGAGNNAVLVGNPPDGTTQNPYGSIAAAQAAGGDVILVRSGSVITEAVTLAQGQHMFGEGSTPQSLTIAGGGSIQLPHQLATNQTVGSLQTPIIETQSAAAVTMASNSEIGNFVFSGTSGMGITGNSVGNVNIHDLKFLSTGGDSIHLTNPSGDVTIRNVQINGSTANGIVIDGGNANLSYFGTGTSITTMGDGFVLQNQTGGTIGISDLSLLNTGGTGLRLNNVDTGVTVKNLTTTGTTGPAVAIGGTTGSVQLVNGVSTNVYNTYDFTGNTMINSPKGAGFTVTGTDAVINIANLNITSTASSPAILLSNASSAITIGNMLVNTTNATGLSGVGLGLLKINGGSINTTNAAAVDIQNSVINTTFGNISVNGGQFGIRLLQSSGVFSVNGTGAYATGGTIQNTTTGVIINSFGTTNLNWIDFASNGVGVQSTKSSALNMTGLRMSSTTNYAVDSLDDSVLQLNSAVLTANGALGGGSIRVRADTIGTFQSLFSNNTINDPNGTAIAYSTLPSGAGASLATSVRSNSITGNRGGVPVIGVVWNGPASVGVSNNLIYSFGSGSTGILLNDTSATDSLVAQVNGNAMLFQPTANQGTGLSVIAANTSQLSVFQNTIDFKATGGIGTRYSLAGTSTDYIASNVITDEAGGATGMLFDTVGANSRLQIDGNTINLLSTDLTTHQGIIFTAVTPTIQFTGTVNNLIYNTTPQSIFSIPVNSATGGFYINGTLE